MSLKPYFSISKDSFEKNAGYKTTVHALAELIDNSFEAEATVIKVLLVTNRKGELVKIGVIDNGKGMSPEILQAAVCEKSGEHLDRKSGIDERKTNKRKLGKYGVGLPKASISQCNKFSVFSWTKKGPENSYYNMIDIEDEEWISNGANVGPSEKKPLDKKIYELLEFSKEKSGTFVLWENLDGLTWVRARWGRSQGLVPSLDYLVGRAYRKMLSGDKGNLKISYVICNDKFKLVEEQSFHPNDPLYITQNCVVPRIEVKGERWPKDDTLFDETTPPDNNHLDLDIELGDGKVKKVRVEYRCSVARKNTFTQVNGTLPGKLPYGKHADKNKGISLLREGREVEISDALVDRYNPRDRWLGVEFDFPHELDLALGMTNNKQSYNRLNQVLKFGFEEYIEEDESTLQCIERIKKEDPNLAICILISRKIREVWDSTKKIHKNMKMGSLKTELSEEEGVEVDDVDSAEGKAEKIASENDDSETTPGNLTPEQAEKNKKEFEEKLRENGIPEIEAKEIAKRIIDRGLSYTIVSREQLGSPFFNIRGILDTKVIELNETHPVYDYLIGSLNIDNVKGLEEAKQIINNTKLCVLLMLEAWAKVEAEAINKEKRQLQRTREDWGRVLEQFILSMKE